MAEPPGGAASRPSRIILALHARADRPWFLPSVGAFPLMDYALPFLPNQLLLIALSMLQPQRWRRLAAVFVIGTSLGALLAALAVQHAGRPLVEALWGAAPLPDAPEGWKGMVGRYGLIGLAGLSLLPSPPRTAVVLCAFAGLPPAGIMIAVATGRIVPVTGFALIGAWAPQWLRRYGPIDRLLREVENGLAPAAPAKNRDR